MNTLETVDDFTLTQLLVSQKRLLENQDTLGILLTECSRELYNNSKELIKITDIIKNYLHLRNKLLNTQVGELVELNGSWYKKMPLYEGEKYDRIGSRQEEALVEKQDSMG